MPIVSDGAPSRSVSPCRGDQSAAVA
jgi:hypothetical protein